MKMCIENQPIEKKYQWNTINININQWKKVMAKKKWRKKERNERRKWKIVCNENDVKAAKMKEEKQWRK